MFKDLRVTGVGASANFQPTLGSLLNPLNTFKEIQNSRHPALRDILSGFEGCVRPGEMLREYSSLVVLTSQINIIYYQSSLVVLARVAPVF